MTKTLKTRGEVFAVNDHVYLSAPWNTAEGAPWLIGRIVEFVDGPSGEVSRIRVAYFLRQHDLHGRHIVDYRLLVAAMHTEICPVSHLRGKCRVLHRDQIDDLDAYKRQPDSFYFNQLYGRYFHRYYDVVLASKIQNSAPEVIDYLRSHFSFVFAEIGMAAQLTDERRGCVTCRQWTSGSDSITCGLCGRVFHLACLDPPLSHKPARGYTWACAPCSKRRQNKVDDRIGSGSPAVAGTSTAAQQNLAASTTAKGKGKQVDVLPSSSENGLITTNGWPFRYFGLHTEPTSVLDPHDSLYPRAATRLGARFQAVLSTDDEPVRPTVNQIIAKAKLGKRSRDGTPLSQSAKAEAAEVERGGDATILDVISIPDRFDDDELFAYLSRAMELPIASVVGVDLIDKALSVRHQSKDSATALAQLRSMAPKDFGFATWTDAESSRLDSFINTMGEDLEGIAVQFSKKSQGDVVRHFYMFKGHRQPDGPAQDQFQDSLPTVSQAGNATKTPDEDSIIGSPPPPKRPRVCALCETKTSTAWWTCPNSVGESLVPGRKCLCDDCSLRWRKYGISHLPSQDDGSKLSKGRRALKNAAKGGASRPASPPPAKPLYVPKPCLLCKRLEPKSMLAQCRNCALSCHASCYGLPDDVDLETWRCEACVHEGDKDARRHPSCALCPSPPEIAAEDALTALNVIKPTEYNGHVHLLCAVWHPEIAFTVPKEMQVVEGLVAIPAARKTKECAVCGLRDVGACIKCDGCSKFVHVGCAWSAGYRFAFELHPLKKKRQKETTSVTFKEETGSMEPKIWCKSHHFSTEERPTYDIGQKDSASGLTALQTFVRAYKVASHDNDFAVLRRARRLDALIEPVLQPESSGDGPRGRTMDPEDDYLLAALGRLPEDYRRPPPVAQDPPKPKKVRKPPAEGDRPAAKSKKKKAPRKSVDAAPLLAGSIPIGNPEYVDAGLDASFEPPAEGSGARGRGTRGRGAGSRGIGRGKGRGKRAPAGRSDAPQDADPEQFSGSVELAPLPPMPAESDTSVMPSLPLDEQPPTRESEPKAQRLVIRLPNPNASAASGSANASPQLGYGEELSGDSDSGAGTSGRRKNLGGNSETERSRGCANCGVTETPCWRRDQYDRELCNACATWLKTHHTDRPHALYMTKGPAKPRKRLTEDGSEEPPKKKKKQQRKSKAQETESKAGFLEFHDYHQNGTSGPVDDSFDTSAPEYVPEVPAQEPFQPAPAATASPFKKMYVPRPRKPAPKPIPSDLFPPSQGPSPAHARGPPARPPANRQSTDQDYAAPQAGPSRHYDFEVVDLDDREGSPPPPPKESRRTNLEDLFPRPKKSKGGQRRTMEDLPPPVPTGGQRRPNKDSRSAGPSPAGGRRRDVEDFVPWAPPNGQRKKHEDLHPATFQYGPSRLSGDTPTAEWDYDPREDERYRYYDSNAFPRRTPVPDLSPPAPELRASLGEEKKRKRKESKGDKGATAAAKAAALLGLKYDPVTRKYSS